MYEHFAHSRTIRLIGTPEYRSLLYLCRECVENQFIPLNRRCLVVKISVKLVGPLSTGDRQFPRGFI